MRLSAGRTQRENSTSYTHQWVEVPLAARGISLDALADVLSTQDVVKEAWLAGSIMRTKGEADRTSTIIALVVDDPLGDHNDVLDRLIPKAAALGLDVSSYAFVEPATAQGSVEPVGVRIYP